MGRTTYYQSAHDERFVSELNAEMDAIHRKLDTISSHEQTIVVTITTGGTEVRHQLGTVPKFVNAALGGNATWWEYRARTERAVFLKSSVEVDAEVTLKG